MVEKSDENYIEWRSQSTKMVGFWLTLCGYYDNTLYTLYTLYTPVIRIEDDLRLGYQRRR